MPQPNQPDQDSDMLAANPFLGMIKPMGGQGGGMPMEMPMMGKNPAGGAPVPAQKPGIPGMEPEVNPEDQMAKGINPDSSQLLIGAIQSLEKYIAKSTDRDEIATARSIIALLTRLIEQDQKNYSSQLG